MSDGNTAQGPSVQIIDQVFAGLAGRSIDPPPPAEADPAALSQMPPPPPLRGPGDLQAAHEWLLRERKRLEGYTQVQLHRLQREHAAIVQQNYLNEQSLILRSQEIARAEGLLANQHQALQERTAEVARREQAVAEQLARSYQAQEAAQAQGNLLASLQEETAALQRSREAARADLEAMNQARKEQQEMRARENALLAVRQEQLEARLLAAERAEADACRRQAEFDELEARLLRECDERSPLLLQREADLEEWQRLLEQVQEELFSRHEVLERREKNLLVGRTDDFHQDALETRRQFVESNPRWNPPGARGRG
jgi:hypothetical protein